MKNKVIVIAGPTASGKTAIGIEVARAIDGEIISADSMQIYKGMSVATAAPTKSEIEQIPHHLTAFLSPEESFSVAQWCTLAREKITDIISRDKTPVIVGGTGLYIDSLVDNIIFEDIKADTALRESLMAKSTDTLYDELLSVDKEAALDIHKNNKKRVVRALELYYSGVTKTQQNINSKKEPSPYNFLYFVLEYSDRQILYDRINKRADIMVQNGLLQEAEICLKRDNATAAQAIGHKELKPFLDGEITFDEAIDNLKKETRHYAKRQITWFKRKKDAVRVIFDDDRDQATAFMIKQCEDFLNG